MTISDHRNTICDAGCHTLCSLINKGNSSCIIGGSNTVFRNENRHLFSCGFKLLICSSDYMLQSLRIKLIIHLGGLCPLWNRLNTIWSDYASRIVLKPKEIVLFYVWQIMSKFFFPLFCSSFFTTIYCLNIMKR